MPKYLIEEINREIWKTTFYVEAKSKAEAEKLYLSGDAEEIDREYDDTVHTEYSIEEQGEDA
jgi:hypothetical protein